MTTQHTVPLERRLRIAATLTGRKQTADTIAKRVAAREGYKHTEETKAKMRQRALGRKLSAETRAKLSESHKGYVITAATKAKMSTVRKGRIMSETERRSHHGARSSFWRGGVNAKNRALNFRVRALYEYIHWRRQVFLRDNFTCQGCGVVGTKLNAHHIKRFQMLMDKYNITTLEQAKACEPLWDIDNGVTLCKACHKQVHKKGGHCDQTTLQI